MKDFIKTYKNPNKDKINYDLINRKCDKPLIEYIADSAKSLEVLKNIEFIGYKFKYYESEIDDNKYNKTRKSRSKKKENYKFMIMEESRVGELVLKFKITFKGESEIIEKPILVPIPDDDGTYTIKGKRYILMYQMVDASTYTTRDSVVLKSLMPIFLTRKSYVREDVEGVEYKCPVYTTKVFNNNIDILYFYFAKIGVDNTLKYMGVDRFIRLTKSVQDIANNKYFQISSKLYVEVNSDIFDESDYVKSMVFMILKISSNRVNINNIYDKTFWIEKIGSLFSLSQNSYEKGKNISVFLDRMLDETTREVLRIDPIHKTSMYAILRWQFQNFNELKKKENLDLANKRLRDNEYIASILNQVLSKRLLPAINSGRKISKEKIYDIFKFPGDILIKSLFSSGLFKYDDQVNDLDFFNKLKYTTKGPNSLGGKNTQNIAAATRGLDPSFIGRIDLNVVSSSDPGTGGVLVPFCKTYGLYFSDKPEPESGKFDIEKIGAKFDERINDAMLIDPFNTFEDYRVFNDKIANMGKVELSSKPSENVSKLYININKGKDNEI